MLITKEWSSPRSVEYGKNITVRASHPNYNFKVFSAQGQSFEGCIQSREYIIDADNAVLRQIRFPMIAFRANTLDELHVDFETV